MQQLETWLRSYDPAACLTRPGLRPELKALAPKGLLRNVVTQNMDNFRAFGPNENGSNSLGRVRKVLCTEVVSPVENALHGRRTLFELEQ